MKQFTQIRQMFSLIRLCSKKYLPFTFIESILSLLSTFGKMLIPAAFVSCITRATIQGLIVSIIFLVLVFALDRGYVLFKRRMDDERILLNKRIEQLLAIKIQKIEYAKLEDPEFLDLKAGASFAISSYRAIENSLTYFVNFINSLSLIVFSSIYLLIINPLLFFLLSIGMIGQTWVAAQLNGKLEGFFKNLYSINRKFDWFNILKTDLTYQKDIRLFRMEKMIVNKMEKYNKQTTTIFKKMNDATFANSRSVDVIKYLTFFLCYLISGLNAFYGLLGPKLNISQFIICISMTNYLTTSLSGLVDDITATFQMLSYLKPVNQLMNLWNDRMWGDIPLDMIKTIEFKNVKFRYPGADKYVLNNVSFKIDEGEKIAIVGINGSGKTTLVKLICGLYEVTEGELLINGRNIRDYDYDSYMSKITVVFQDYHIFDFSLEENVAMSTYVDRKKVKNVINEVNLESIVANLPNKYNSNIGVQISEDGVSLSGGEKQRLVIARAIYKGGTTFIFDEPTSSLDPVAEYEIYKKYNQIVKGKSCIFISHRMATTRFCDRIIVLAEGKVLENGTHDELLELENGLYKELYQKQRNILGN